MNKYNTKLGQLLFLLERPRFEKCVKATGADKHCKGFSAWQQFVTMALCTDSKSARTSKPGKLAERK